MEAPTEDELEVAGILQALPEFIFRSDQQAAGCPPRSLRWLAKKKRSVDRRRRGRFLRSSRKSPCPLPPTSLLPQPPLPAPQPRAAANHCSAPLSPDAQKAKVKTPLKAAVAETSSPSSPLCFYPSSEENDNNNGGIAGSNLVTGAVKKTMTQNKKRIREQNGVIARLVEENQSLQQERADFATQYQSLCAENSRLKESKSKREMEQRSRIQQGQQQSPSSSPVGPVDPVSAHRQQQQPRPYPIVPIEPALFPADQKSLRERRSTTPPKDETLPFPAPLVSPHLWTLRGEYETGGGGGGGRMTLLPDLNARLDDSEFGLVDPEPEQQKQQLMMVVGEQQQQLLLPQHMQQPQLQQMRSTDEKRMATAEARKKRLEINRRKAAAAAALRNGRVPFR